MNINQKAVNTLRILSADQVQKANSGHPGLPLGAAPIAYELWANHLNHNPKNPNWVNRDRFILSAGHGSALLYSLLHMFGYGNLSIDDLKNFRQFGSLTPGHPEYKHTVGVEATTGPLGAGVSTAVGMAIAEAHLGGVFNKEGYPVVDHYTYALTGDGCLMEGISYEALSLAGTLELGKLIVLYDSNKITIEGDTDAAFKEDVAGRFEAFGFQVQTVEDANDLEALSKAIEIAKAEKTKPSLIICKTQIGYGCPAKVGKANAHGEPLGEENVKELRKFLGWDSEEAFEVSEEIYSHYRDLAAQGAKKEEEWNAMFNEYADKFPEEKAKWDEFYSDIDMETLMNNEELFAKPEKSMATRAVSGEIINKLKDIFPNMLGGSADLGPSNKSEMKDQGFFSAENRQGRNIHFGVREMAMTAITNGIYLHGGLKAFCATFFVFSDFMKPMIRLASLMGLPVAYVLTHDSIGVGEDGPTHEPIEQLAMLRTIPNLNVFRPADYTETAVAWVAAMGSESTPTAIALTRQNLPQLEGSSKEAIKGAYVIAEAKNSDKIDLIIMASGSEVELALGAKEELEKDGKSVRVVSVPCMDIFEGQDVDYKESVLPSSVRARLAVEAGATMPWYKYVGIDGAVVGMEGFGASAPAKTLFEHFGFTVNNVVEVAKGLIK
ncbi:transketolase [Peptostreptococcus anaerobius]|uniref:Transketolase n=1 Tax=Peptostreptococcus anaerobius TaxID=1261 RepID=A0A135YVK3_9FIRM|nr:transketolase [Peptostreptococcus anaerobius]KXB71286.1 transketolase [Peptostreptococcus anaerobius]KXI13434.1 transketolase [Peptostreptococcus anaerobius]MDB8852738.1 transketolase [Peptostreptococcus anaerobius]MDU0965016.1 transketolase [Peptostreptococcus anaerobius]MDU0998770.1 transketolase [Peptostreptococcus anaerobius]